VPVTFEFHDVASMFAVDRVPPSDEELRARMLREPNLRPEYLCSPAEYARLVEACRRMGWHE
jgi:hypothetical protein